MARDDFEAKIALMTETAQGRGHEPGPRTATRRPLPRGAVASGVTALAIMFGLGLGGCGSGSAPPARGSQSPSTAHHVSGPVVVVLTKLGLTTWAKRIHNLLYWEGPAQNGYHYALTQNSKGWLYVSYLPPGETATSTTPLRAHQYVATFAFHNAYAATKAAAGKQSSVKLPAPNGAVAFSDKTSPTSAYLAFKGSDYQIQVFDPSPARVRHLIASGAIRPVAHIVPGGVSH